jgi:hypothetical protein
MQAEKMITDDIEISPAVNWRGVDVSTGRIGQLDQLGLRYIKRHAGKGERVKVVDLGGGSGGHSLRMARAGAAVWMVDLADTARAAFDAAEGEELVAYFIHKDFANLKAADVPEGVNMLYSQRALHYLRYDEAQALLRKISGRMARKARVYVSVAGVDSLFAQDYPHADKPIEERFSPLAPAMREKYHLHLPIAVYDGAGLRQLLESSGFRGVKTRLSEAGGWNLEAIAWKP